MAKRIRKGNHPSNPYASEAATAPRHEDRPGWPFPAQPNRDGTGPFQETRLEPSTLSDEEQLGREARLVRKRPTTAAAPDEEPIFVLRASDRLASMLVRSWANLAAELGLATADDLQYARMVALQMDEWRRKNRGVGP
jgi:hypothetical protein